MQFRVAIILRSRGHSDILFDFKREVTFMIFMMYFRAVIGYLECRYWAHRNIYTERTVTEKQLICCSVKWKEWLH